MLTPVTLQLWTETGGLLGGARDLNSGPHAVYQTLYLLNSLSSLKKKDS